MPGPTVYTDRYRKPLKPTTGCLDSKALPSLGPASKVSSKCCAQPVREFFFHIFLTSGEETTIDWPKATAAF